MTAGNLRLSDPGETVFKKSRKGGRMNEKKEDRPLLIYERKGDWVTQ